MKIFHLITLSEYGGAQSVVANICRELERDSLNRVFIIYGGGGEAFRDLPPGIRRVCIGRGAKQISPGDVLVFFRLLYLRFKYRPDVVHLHSSKMGALGRVAFSGRKVIYTVHGFDSMRVAFRRFLFVEKLLAKRAYRIIGVSRYDLKGMRLEKINGHLDMIYNGIPDFKEEQSSQEFDKDLIDKLSSIRSRYEKVVMCIARISPQKNVDLFLQTAGLLPSYAFLWIGNEEEVGNAADNVFFLGSAPFAYRYLSFCDLFVLPTRYEGLPVSILEAFCMGKPVIASGVGGIPEMIRDGVNGFALDNDAALFVRHIDRVLSDPRLLAEMGVHARCLFLERFSVKGMVDKYLLVYKQMMQKNAKPTKALNI